MGNAQTVHHITMWLLPATMLLLGTAHPRLFLKDGIATNGTHRFARIASVATTGRLQPLLDPFLASVAEVRGGYCGAPSNTMLYYGAPPAACRGGHAMRGTVQNGFAELHVRTPQAYSGATVPHVVRYPADEPGVLATTYSIGPFDTCYRGSPTDPYADHYCATTMGASYFLDGNQSTVWVDKTPLDTNNYLCVYCSAQVIVLALLAAANDVSTDATLLQIAADSAVGGALFQAVAIGTGMSVVGLAEEIGDDGTANVSATIATLALALAGMGWVVGLTVSGTTTKLQFSDPLPAAVVRECLELPIMLSLPAMWPPGLGRSFTVTMNFALGLAIPTVAGRTISRLNAHTPYQLWAAATLAVAVLSGAALTLPVVALSGGVSRGNECIAMALTIAAHCTLAGYYATTVWQQTSRSTSVLQSSNQ